MRTTALVSALAFLCAGTAQAAGLTVNAPVNGGSTLAVTALDAPSFAIQLNGSDQTASYQADLQVVDARGLGSGGGWNLTLTSTPFVGSSTIASITAGCHPGSTCALPSNSVANTNIALPVAPAAAKILNAASGTGLGRIDVNVNVSVAIPAKTLASSYSSVLTVAVAAGP